MSQFVRIDVPYPDDILDAEAFGAGALVAVEKSSTGGGLGFTELDTEAVVSGQTSYTVFDATGGSGTFYRTRYSNAARSVQSGYGTEFQVTTPLLTVAQFREHVRSSLADGAIQRLLEANTLAITQRAGPIGSQTITFYPRRSVFLYLDRPAATITTVREIYGDPVGISGIDLATNDYKVLQGGRVLERWGYGTSPADWWSDRVEVTYVPVDDSAERIRVLLKLCELDLNRSPGSSGLRIGNYSEQQRNEAYNEEREAILASLVPSGLAFA